MNKFRSVSVLLTLFLISAVSSAESLPDFTTLAEKSIKFVVHITTKKNPKELPKGEGKNRFQQDRSLDDFMKRFYGNPQNAQPSTSLGSGFIYDKRGYIITNHHVIKGADEIEVSLPDLNTYPATIVGSDPLIDIAVIKIDAKNLPVAKLGKSSKIKVGEWVLAIGSPFGFDHSVTKGIVSAISRSLANVIYTPFIQTDVPVNPGNSGGPLINLRGEVVGVNSMILSRTGTYSGLSFAIPIDTVITTARKLRENKKIVRGWLGVSIQTISRQLAESFGLRKPSGALVVAVVPDSPAERAGFKAGDVILAFNKKKILLSSDLPPIVGASPIKVPFVVNILRDKKKKKLTVRLAELKQDNLALGGNTPGGSQALASYSFYGMTVENTPNGTGVKVIDVQPSSAARKAGIVPGDTILKIRNQNISSARDCRNEVDAIASGTQVPVLVRRGSATIFVAVKAP